MSCLKGHRSSEEAFHMPEIEEMSLHLDDPSQMTHVQDQDDVDDDSMDTDEEGGVRIITESCEASSPDEQQVKRVYYQAPVTELDCSSCMWKLPAEPGQYHPKKLKHSQDHPIIKAYQKHCGLISKHWNCHPDNCIPPEVRKQTPYSLAMLRSLRRLACFTKQNFQFAQSQLLESWQSRTKQYEALIDQNVLLSETVAKRTKNMGSDYEFKIQENLLGLILEDVERVWRSVKQAKTLQRAANKAKRQRLNTPKHISRQQKKLARNLARNEELQSSIAERVTKRRRNQRGEKRAAAQTTSFADELVDIQIGSPTDRQTWLQGALAVPPNSPISTYDRRNILAPEPALREAGSRHNEQANLAHQDDEALYKPSKSDRHHDNVMSQSLVHMNIDSRKGLRRRRLRRLETGGQSRSDHPKVVMPSEKTKLDSLPCLPAIPPATSTTDLTQIGQIPLPDQTPFTLPVRTRRSG